MTGSADGRKARADRIHEQSLKAQAAAEQSRQGTQNAVATMRRELISTTDENEVSKVTAPGVSASLSLPWWSRGAIGIALAFLILAIAVSILRHNF